MTRAFPYYVNMLPDQWVRSRQSVREARRWILGITASVLAAGVPFVAVGVHLRASPLPSQGSLGQLQNEIESIQAELPVLGAKVEGLVERERELRLRDARVRWIGVLDRIGPMLPEGTRLVSFTGEVYTSELVIELLIENASASVARSSVVTFEQSGIFDSVDMLESVVTTRDGAESVRSTVRLRIAVAESGASS